MNVYEIKGRTEEEINLEILNMLNEEKELNLFEMTRECEKEERKQFLNYIFKTLINMEDSYIERNIDDFYRDRKLKIIYMDKLYIQSNIIILFNTKNDGLFFDNEFWAYSNKGTNKKVLNIRTVQKIIRKMSEVILNEKNRRKEIEDFLKNNRIAGEEKISNELLLKQIQENIWL
ncbi:hypothetical protein EII29_07405 [Leptotrichia sp. OH3620_COT-345]|uniref:hypothetical protein n=1 Tax=Leptotrichia sp. OH3620_COT-345 TaxID=2491048 RepID=UPI000F654EA7|nr:hypothetical protein [Leptotrichia sp. OH3620_COT-345]RRD39405.1 hypothetical protein EII29_07405 [Leptotrichia sp. OH3620_COT-345]